MTAGLDKTLDLISQAARRINASGKTVALTGAGLSTPSGIPDFRSEGSGLWTRFLPMEVASLSTFRYEPEKFFAWLHPLASHMWTAIPNPAHLALARLEEAGMLSGIITQNIDGLHTRAGSREVYEVHGTLNTMTCTGCYQQVPAAGSMEAYLREGAIPYCSSCGSILKPDIILFEEQLPIRVWQRAQEAAETCDLMIIAGTSLEVMPSAGLPVKALNNGAELIIVNRSPTYIDPRASILIEGDVAEIIPLIVSAALRLQ